MKKVALFLLLLIGVNFAQNIHWLGDYDKALEKAKAEKRALLLLVVKKDKNSTKILKNYFSQKEVIQAVNSKTKPVIVLFEGKINYPIEMFYTTTFPTLFIIDSKYERLKYKPLYGDEINAKSLLKILKLF